MPAKPAIVKCPKCDADNNAERVVCLYCGNPMRPAGESQITATTKDSDGTAIVVKGVIQSDGKIIWVDEPPKTMALRMVPNTSGSAVLPKRRDWGRFIEET